jgi:hypothetical protein
MEYQDYCKQLGHKRLSKKEIAQLTSDYQSLVTQFGTNYKNKYGWASTALNNPDPTFRQIEENVGLEHMRPYYRLANHNIHAGSKGIFFRLGLNEDAKSNLLLAGPSTSGLADPGHGTARSLTQITTCLITIEPTLDAVVTSQILLNFCDEIGDQMQEAHDAIQQIVKPQNDNKVRRRGRARNSSK